MRKSVQIKKLLGTSLRCMISSKAKMLFLAIFSFFFLQMNLYAQEKLITGVITDTKGESLPGVNIVIKGTLTGTLTNVEGQFSIQAKPEDILVASFIGYKDIEVQVGTRQVVNITLSEDIAQLEEVVVIGYGTQKKKLVINLNQQKC